MLPPPPGLPMPQVMQLNINRSQIWYKNVGFQCKKYPLTSPSTIEKSDPGIPNPFYTSHHIMLLSPKTSPNYDCCLEGQDIRAKTILDGIIGDINQE
uniref:Uncharacterized protein n=1 Tax=Romanomermis culicivorax TaxID=13658 RepID=A0A915KJL2_ROMCU